MNIRKSIIYTFSILAGFFFITSCGDKEEEEPFVAPSIFIENNTRFEGNDASSTYSFIVKIDRVSTKDVSVDFTTQEEKATAGEDFETQSGSITIPVGATQAAIDITVFADERYEEDETFKVIISNPTNATISGAIGLGTIRNDDPFSAGDDEGYTTPLSYPGYSLTWSDEFDQTSLNDSDWNYETGGGGWGNEELQNYSSSPNNSFISEGKLVIEAQDGGNYTSARLTTQGKRFFQYGRIDIRAKLPEGQGVWPALWMLGESFSTEGWPKCGEIDIMELVGHQPNKVHGTIHWDNNGSKADFGGNTSLSGDQKFSDEFHVFSIIWNSSSIRWYLDDNLYHTADIAPASLSEFREPFFLIFNVAVGGLWPGSPDDSTVFPQRMIVDYVRVFQ